MIDFKSLFKKGISDDSYVDSLPKVFSIDYEVRYIDSRNRRKSMEKNAKVISYTIEEARDMIYESVKDLNVEELRFNTESPITRVDGVSQEVFASLLSQHKVQPVSKRVNTKLGKIEDIPTSILISRSKVNTDRTPILKKDTGDIQK